jgi:hypothetical protein
MKYTLRRPCPHCPFRTDIPPYLRGGRAQEIAESLARGGSFPCHRTTVDDEEEDGELTVTDDSQFCAGAILAMENGPGGPNQVLRIAERVGLYDASKLDRSAPVGTLLDFVRHHAGDDDEEESEPCAIAGPGCLAPAGYLIGGEVVPVVEREPTRVCEECSESICDACWDEHQEEHE